VTFPVAFWLFFPGPIEWITVGIGAGMGLAAGITFIFIAGDATRRAIA
jgi:hypothetical protein